MATSKSVSELTNKAIPALTDELYLSDASTNPPTDKAVTVQALLQTTSIYKKYVALLTQTGTDAPTVTVLENTLGETVTWTYGGVGIYNGDTVTGILTTLKTAVSMPNTASGLVLAYSASTSNITVNTKAITTGANTNGMLLRTRLEVTLYP